MSGLAELVICSPPAPREPARLETTRRDGYVVYPHPRIIHAWEVARSAWWDHGLKRVRVTSISEGKHSTGSLHYRGMATDFGMAGIHRVKKRALSAAIRKRLKEDYDVVLEGSHIHVEFDPKVPSAT